ncbi:MFS transporter [Periweissella ghanensis]|uniref:Tetracycline resistance protein, class B n=1 Tax=Periweissella ghanensis TaxID=467997 RepID=A0ABN8BR61_9LACO|nr:MFS transporter [Periweissella ghanensis]MCM0601293.1 MFS transporter [Periweissella ghanensis]CAH0419355.1 Tetracycline resistance protein, class B [Periweissella ghanensis]
MSAATKRAIFILVLSEFLVCLGVTLVIPVMPFLKNELHFSAADMGFMTALFALAQFVFSPLVGIVSDRIGRKPVLIIGLVLYSLSEVIFALTNQLWLLDVSRIIGGLSAAAYIPTAMAMAADITTTSQRAKVIGWISAAFSGGLILGPGIGGVLANISYKMPFWVASVLGLVALLVLLTLLPNENQFEHHVVNNKQAKETTNWREVLTKPVVLLFTLILVSAFGLAGFEGVYSIFVNEVFDFNMNDLAIVLILNGIISLILQVVFFERLVLWFSEIKLIRYCFAISALGVAWILVTHSKLAVVVATLIVFSAMDIIRPAITTYLTKFGESKQGLMNGLNMSLTSVGNVAGPIMAGILLDINYHYPYGIVLVFMCLSIGMTFFITKNSK